MKTVWLLTETMDYESTFVHSVYEGKPESGLLSKLIKDSFGYGYTESDCDSKAKELVEQQKVRILNLYTWRLEERAVVESK